MDATTDRNYIHPQDARQNGLYVARRAECGCCFGVSTDSRNKATANAVAEWIADGLVVTHVSWDMYRNVILAEETFMDCPHVERQLEFPIRIRGVGYIAESEVEP